MILDSLEYKWRWAQSSKFYCSGFMKSSKNHFSFHAFFATCLVFFAFFECCFFSFVFFDFSKNVWYSNCYNFFRFSCISAFLRLILKSDCFPNIVIACGMRHGTWCCFSIGLFLFSTCGFHSLEWLRILLLVWLCSFHFVAKLLYATFTNINIECYHRNNYRYTWNLT